MAAIKKVFTLTNPTEFNFVGLVDCGKHGNHAAFAKQSGVSAGGFVVPSSDVQIFTAPADSLRGPNAITSLDPMLREQALAAIDGGAKPVMRFDGRTLFAGNTRLGDSRVDHMFFAEVPLKYAKGYREPTRLGASYAEPNFTACVA